MIRREAPAIVGEETWQKAQENLQSHFVFGVRDACHQYLLRGLIKCALCSKTKVWDLHSGQELWTLAGPSDGVVYVEVTPDGQRAYSVSWDNTLKVWDLHSGQELWTLAGPSDEVEHVAVTPDGQWAVSASWDMTLQVWDLNSGQEIGTLAGHGSYVSHVAVTPDGRRAVSAPWDKTLKVWDLNSGEATATFHADAPIRCCAVTSNRIVAGDTAGRVHILLLK